MNYLGKGTVLDKVATGGFLEETSFEWQPEGRGVLAWERVPAEQAPSAGLEVIRKTLLMTRGLGKITENTTHLGDFKSRDWRGKDDGGKTAWFQSAQEMHACAGRDRSPVLSYGPAAGLSAPPGRHHRG